MAGPRGEVQGAAALAPRLSSAHALSAHAHIPQEPLKHRQMAASSRPMHGCAAVHWAAGSGHLAVLEWLLRDVGMGAESVGGTQSRSKRRRPLHFAARTGHVSLCAPGVGRFEGS